MKNQNQITLSLPIFCFFVLIASCIPQGLYAQQKEFYYLDAVSDRIGNTHLFYHYTDTVSNIEWHYNINHLDVNSNADSVFLSGLSYHGATTRYFDLHFFEQDLTKYIYTEGSVSNGDGFQAISRFDTVHAFRGFITHVNNKFITGDDEDTVFASIDGYTIISPDGGITWPKGDYFEIGVIPDSVTLDFPLHQISPYNPKLMLGSDWNRNNSIHNTLITSVDGGKTAVTVNDTLGIVNNTDPLFGPKNNVSFDPDSHTVYITDYYYRTDTVLSLFRSSNIIDAGSWEVVQVYDDKMYHPLSSTETKGKLYLWNEIEILISTDYGDSFQTYYSEPKNKIKHVATVNDRLFLITPFKLLEIVNGEAIPLKTFFVGIEEQIKRQPKQVTLHQNYPNPFNPSTTLSFTLTEPSSVTLEIYNMLGQRVAQLSDNKKFSSGRHSLRYSVKESMSSGIYFYRIITKNIIETKSMTLIK